VDLLRADPGRVSRDLVASSATFTAEDVDRWTCARLSDGGPQWCDYVLRSDATIRARSLDTEHPMLTTAQHLDFEERVFANATRLSQTRDPLFDAGALERAIAEVQKAKRLTYSEEQRAGVALSRSASASYRATPEPGKVTSWRSSSARIHLDNAKEFHGEMLRRACEQYGIHLEYRPVAQPHMGRHIERLLGTLMRALHELPGATFSSPQQRGRYPGCPQEREILYAKVR
jgi:hypothetical protein